MEMSTVRVMGWYRDRYQSDDRNESDDLVHRSFAEEHPARPHMRLIPCIAYWVSSERWNTADTYPTCVRCIAARRP